MSNEVDPYYDDDNEDYAGLQFGRLPGSSNEEDLLKIPDNFSAQETLDCRVTAIPQVGDQVLIWAEGLNGEEVERWGVITEVKKDGNKGCSIKIKLDLLPGEKKQRVVCRKPDGIIFHR